MRRPRASRPSLPGLAGEPPEGPDLEKRRRKDAPMTLKMPALASAPGLASTSAADLGRRRPFEIWLMSSLMIVCGVCAKSPSTS